MTRAFATREPALFVNVAANGGSVRAELRAVDGAPIPGYEVDNCVPVESDETAAQVNWRGNPSPAAFIEKPIRLYLTATRASLYSATFANAASIRDYSLAVIVNPKSAFNCYWPMPFRKSCRITFSNEDHEELRRLTYQITYQETEVPASAAYLYAQWRRAVTERSNPDYVIADGIRGRGKYVGTFLAWTQLSKGWFGEGEIKFFMDGDTQFPTICGTGTEDYLCGSYGFPENYSTAYVGNVLPPGDENGPPKWSLYRWHIMDPICFDRDLRVTIQTLGWWPNRKYQPLADDIASVAYWYQSEPHAPFPELPALPERWPR